MYTCAYAHIMPIHDVEVRGQLSAVSSMDYRDLTGHEGCTAPAEPSCQLLIFFKHKFCIGGQQTVLVILLSYSKFHPFTLFF